MPLDNHIGLPTDPNVAGKVVESQAQQAIKKLDRGLIGSVFGTRDHVPNNVAGLIVVIGFGIIAYLALNAANWTAIKDQISALGAFVTLALGYLFGRATKD